MTIDLISMETCAKKFDDNFMVIHTYEVYREYDFIKASTIVTIINSDTRREINLEFPFINRDENNIADIARAIIEKCNF